MKYKRIYLFLYGEIGTDGRVQRSIEFLKSFQELEIHLISCGHSDYPIDGVIQHLVRIKPIGILNYIKFYKASKHIIDKEDINKSVFYLHDYYSILLAGAIRKRDGVYIYDAHELLIKDPGQKYTKREKLLLWAEKRYVHDAYRVIAANAEREMVMKETYRLNNTLYVLNIADYKYQQIAGTIDVDTNWIVYQGVIIESRKLSFFIKSLKYLPSNYKIIFIGGGKSIDFLQKIAREENVSDRVCFTGRLSNKEMMEKLKECKVGIISYPFTTLNNIYCSPNKLYEYTAIGMPVISSKQPFLEKVITEYNIGGLFDFDNEKDFANNVEKIVDNYNLYTRNIPSFVKDYNIDKEKKKFVEALTPLFK